MPDTYTKLLNLRKITPGGAQDLWGDYESDNKEKIDAQFMLAPLFQAADYTLVPGDAGRRIYATGTTKLTMPNVGVGWPTGPIKNSNTGPTAGTITLAVPTGATLDGVLNGTTLLYSKQVAAIIQTGTQAYITEWILENPVTQQIIKANTTAVDFAAPPGFTRYEYWADNIKMSAAASDLAIRLAPDSGTFAVANYNNGWYNIDSSGGLSYSADTGTAVRLFENIDDAAGQKRTYINAGVFYPGDNGKNWSIDHTCIARNSNGYGYRRSLFCASSVVPTARMSTLRILAMNNQIAEGTFNFRCVR